MAAMAGRYLRREYTLGGLALAPLTPLLGAQVRGLDLRRELPAGAAAAIHEALRRHKVLFFRGQELTGPEFVAFGRRLGPLHPYAPAGPLGGGDGVAATAAPELRVFDYGREQKGREAFWHFDVLPSRRPARASILRARVVPEVGGDTLFCDLEAVYASLPEALRARLDGAVGVYDFVFERQLARFRGKDEAEAMALCPEVPLVEIPLVVPGPGGRGKVVLVNPGFLVGIRGMSAQESREALLEMKSAIARPDSQCRFRWESGDIAFWDNRACLHYATNNYWPERRTMERLTLLDDA
jgi:taurine dioxygenase